ncbi:unnamed protein product [Meloidogyne enterolobii]|uniref:Uncharacterized protein n=2 Tax=Meloidogyne enterolobii TaxID=390850 RepID=A0ACB0YTK2_MELEN|nr:unnamed protein product [Meloidogyne enterolobii]
MLKAFKSHLKQLTSCLCIFKCCSKSNNSIQPQPELAINSIMPFPLNDPTKTNKRVNNYKSTKALLTGQKLIIGREEEQRVYFNELRKSWDVPPCEMKKKYIKY